MKATRVGIELSPVACRIVEIEGGAIWRTSPPDVRVQAFDALPRAGPATAAWMASLRGRRVAVVAWGAGAEYRRLEVEAGTYVRMRAEALAEMRSADRADRRSLAEIAPAGPPALDAARRPVVIAAVSSDRVRALLAPLVAAGIRIQSVVTPAGALLSLARLRREFGIPGATEAYVALEETATALTLVRDGSLLAARDLAWGYVDLQSPAREARARESIAQQLSDELAAFFAENEGVAGRVSQVCICGAVPDLRSTTVPLMEALDLEVEALDSLFGIDTVHLPDPSDEFRERAAELRLAWAVASDRAAPLNLLREEQRRAVRARLSRAAVVAGVAAGVGAGWSMTRSKWWQSRPLPVRTVAHGASTPIRAPLAPVAARAAATPRDLKPPPVLTRPVPAPVKPRPVVGALALAPPRPVPPASLPLARADPAGVARTEITEPRPIESAPQKTATRSGVQRPVAHPVREPPPIAFDAVLGTILHASDRKLAVIDGHIVQSGDDVRGARVVDITPTAVLLRDDQGRLMQLTLERPNGRE